MITLDSLPSIEWNTFYENYKIKKICNSGIRTHSLLLTNKTRYL